MEQFSIHSNTLAIDDDKDREIKKIVKKRKINKKPTLIPSSKSFAEVIDSKKIMKVEKSAKI